MNLEFVKQLTFGNFVSELEEWEKSAACVSVPLMGEKLPYYCRVKKILAAVKNGPKLARPVVKSALEKLSLSVWKQFSNNPNGRTACPCPNLCVTRHRLPARHCSATLLCSYNASLLHCFLCTLVYCTMAISEQGDLSLCKR